MRIICLGYIKKKPGDSRRLFYPVVLPTECLPVGYLRISDYSYSLVDTINVNGCNTPM